MAYGPVDNYSFLFYPPPYNFLAPPATMAPGQVVPEDVLQPAWKSSGLGCGGGGCSCGGTCGGGLGQTTGGLFGTGLFQSADPSTWGVGEWATIGIGGFLAISAVNTSQTVGKRLRRR